MADVLLDQHMCQNGYQERKTDTHCGSSHAVSERAVPECVSQVAAAALG